MKTCLRILVIVLTLILVVAAISRSQSALADPGVPDTLYIDSVTAFTVGSGVVPLSFTNDEELSALEVTLRHNTTEVKIDSFSFAGGRVANLSNKGFFKQDDSVTYTVYAQVASEDFVAVGSGLLGRLYYSWPSSISPQVITIDTVTATEQGGIERSTVFRSDVAELFTPQSSPGFIDIQSAPLVMDSIWLDNVEAEAGEQVAVNINLYNERNIKAVSVALLYGSDFLIYDSVSFEGTRGLNANSKQVQHSASFNKLWTMVSYTEEVPLLPGSGPLAIIHFTVDADATEELVLIDSTTYFTIGNTFIDLTAADGSEQITPFFTPGSVNIVVYTDVVIIGDDSNLPDDYRLGQNYPNPFNPSTTIEFALPMAGPVRLDVYNILGQNVNTLIDRHLPAGVHQVTFNGRSDNGSPLASGVYFYRLVSSDFVESRKMMLVK